MRLAVLKERRAAETRVAATPDTVKRLIALGVSASVGVVFGYLPARRAAALQPVDALRHE